MKGVSKIWGVTKEVDKESGKSQVASEKLELVFFR